MKLFTFVEGRMKKLTLWDISLVKTVTFLFGLLVGAFIPTFVKSYLWPIATIFVVGYAFLIYRIFGKS